MNSLIERKLPDGRSVADIIFAPLDKAKGILNFVDVGARNGSFLLPDPYAVRCRLTGFEPNDTEYQKLIHGVTDAKIAGLIEPAFRERIYYPHALWSQDEERTLYLTAGPGAATLMGPADEHMTSKMWRERDGDLNFFQRVQRTVGTAKVGCIKLDNVWPEPKDTIDILKLDVEGAELDVMKGSVSLLSEKKILLIYSEFCFLPLYERRITLGHQQVFLDDLGYRLIALNLDHVAYNWGPTTIRSENDRRMTYAGDAIFVLDPDRNSLSPDTLYRLGLACIVMGFNAFGLNLIRASELIEAVSISAIEQEANRVSLSRRFLKVWQDVPNYVYRLRARLFYR